MSFATFLYQLLIGPLQLFFEILYSLAYLVTHDPGISIIVLSLGMNLLVLPLYRRADAMQAEERELEKKLQPWTDHIRKAFHGDERFMILQTYYRQNHYKPVYALKGTLSLLLEIPFFIAAYRFLSELSLLQGCSFGIIRDLGAPDALISLNGFRINVLPILMTLINLVSGYIYTRGLSLKSRIQLYATALVFLVFLYQSPSGLVFYWTLNNVFSLVKNIIYKLKNPGRAPGSRKAVQGKILSTDACRSVFWRACLFLCLLSGCLIPSAVIASSPEEFVNAHAYQSPLFYILAALALAAGFFLVWFRVFYSLSGAKGRQAMSAVSWIAAGSGLVNYMFFGTNLGTLSASLQYDEPPFFDAASVITNLAVLLVLGVLLYWLWKNHTKMAAFVLLAASAAVICMSAVNAWRIHTQAEALKERLQFVSEDEPAIRLSRTGKNVIVLMMDRAISSYLPFLMEERPELQEEFSGFTFYPNTIAYGGYTNFGTPPLFGGYEYTPVEMNRRKSELLASKHNEALKVMPVLFDEAGFEVTISDPPYAGYTWNPDLSVFDDYPQFHCFITDGRFTGNAVETAQLQRSRLNRNFFCYSLMKILPLFCQPTIYSEGAYSSAGDISIQQLLDDSSETREEDGNGGFSRAVGLNHRFMNGYTVLENLNNLTVIREEGPGTFLMMSNNTTHEPSLLKEPEYVPAPYVDNTQYDDAHPGRSAADGRSFTFTSADQVIHYQTNMASMLMLGKWLDYLKENGVYDNTRIIIVSDHGRDLRQFDDLLLFGGSYDIMFYQAFLMVKDFGAQGDLQTVSEFMTNADVPLLAMKDLVEAPRNPFTGKRMTDDAKEGEQFILTSLNFDVSTNNGTTFQKARWLAVHDNIFDRSNWRLCQAGDEPQ